MAFFTLAEVFDVLIMSLATGYIFMDMFKRPADSDDPIAAYRQQSSFKQRFLYAVALVAPAILLHELGHKFVAMGYGLQATFHAAYTWLGIGVVLKLLSFPFLIVVPAYVSTVGASAAQTVWIAAAGPLVNGALYILSRIMVSQTKDPKKATFWRFSQYINGFLFVFNFIPIPGFDGHAVFSNIAALF